MAQNSDIANRLKELRLKNNMEQTDVAEKMGYKSFTTISKWESGVNLPNGGKLAKLAQLFNTTTDYILFGNNQSASNNTMNHVPQILSIYDKLEPDRQEKVLDFAKEQLEEQKSSKVVSMFDKQLENEELFKVKGTTFAAAASGFGRGYEADDYDTYTVYTDEEPPRYDYAIGVRGDSMLPRYEAGDMLYICDRGMSTYSGQLCIVTYNGQTYFKKVYTENDGLRLVSLNKKYSDIFIEYPPAEDTYIKIYDVVGSFTPIEM